MAQASLGGKATAEFLGTFWLTFGGCGSAVLAAAFRTAGDPSLFLGIGFLGVAFAFGLTVLRGLMRLATSRGAISTLPSRLACGQADDFPPLTWCHILSHR